MYYFQFLTGIPGLLTVAMMGFEHPEPAVVQQLPLFTVFMLDGHGGPGTAILPPS